MASESGVIAAIILGFLLGFRHATDADHVLAFLVDDRVDGDGRLPRLTVADDQLALTAADGDHRIDGLEAGLEGLVHGLASGDAGGQHLPQRSRGGYSYTPGRVRVDSLKALTKPGNLAELTADFFDHLLSGPPNGVDGQRGEQEGEHGAKEKPYEYLDLTNIERQSAPGLGYRKLKTLE